MKLDHKIGRSLKKASPTILTCIGAAGVVATAVLAVKATPKADSLIKADSRRNHDGDPYAATKLEAVKSCWKCYIPAAATGVATIICIFGANTLNKKQQASLASAYALVNRSYAAGSEMAESAEGGLSGVLQTIADIVSGGFDMEPVIRPVLDLSAVSAGADALNNLFYSQRAVGLVGQAAVAFEAQRGGSSQTTISVDNDDVVAELRTLRGEMASMLERMEKLRVVLNTGALVGELAEPMDVALGQRSTQRGRGI